jgi:aspartate/methionine/tyrosine aminotransferase
MEFEPFGLHDWLATHEDHAKFLIGHSGVKTATLRDLGVDSKLLAEGDLGYGPLPAHPMLHSKVASIHGVGLERSLVTLAGSEADLLGIWACIKPGDKVVVENPTYPPLRAVPKALGAKVVLHQRTWKNRFQLDFAKLGDQLKGAKLLVVSNLNNPTGAAISRRELEELHALAEKRKVRVLVDEAFRELAREPIPPAATIGNQFLSTGTLTKCYGLAGLRTGWLLGAPEVIARAKVAKTHTSIGMPGIEQRLALVALEKRDHLLKRATQIRDENFAKVQAWMGAHPTLEWVEPFGGLIGFPKLPEGVDDVAFATSLVKDRNTLIAPGTVQGLKGHFRIGFGGDPAHLGPGLRNLDEVLARETGAAPPPKPPVPPAPGTVERA